MRDWMRCASHSYYSGQRSPANDRSTMEPGTTVCPKGRPTFSEKQTHDITILRIFEIRKWIMHSSLFYILNSCSWSVLFQIVGRVKIKKRNWAMFPERDCLLSDQQSYTYSRLLYDGLTSFLGSACSSTLRPIQSKSKKRCFLEKV